MFVVAKPLTAVVTGAARGIGLALCEALHARGAELVLADVDANALSAAATRLGATDVTVDVADPTAMSAFAARVPQARLICLNAGVVGTSLGAEPRHRGIWRQRARRSIMFLHN